MLPSTPGKSRLNTKSNDPLYRFEIETIDADDAAVAAPEQRAGDFAVALEVTARTRIMLAKSRARREVTR